MMALRAVCPDYGACPVDEFMIWREANTVFMGEGHPGCGPYGLALAAVRRGARAAIWLSQRHNMFAATLEDSCQSQIMHMVEQRDLADAENAGVVIIERSFLLRDVLGEAAGAVLLLVKDSSGVDDHWIVLVPEGQDGWVVFDPDQTAGHTEVNVTALERRLPDHRAAIFLRRP